MKINKSINTTIITDNNKNVLDSLKEEIIINFPKDIKNIKDNSFVVFNDAIRYLKKKDQEKLMNLLEEKNIHFLNVTSNIEECLYTYKLIVINDGKIALEGTTISVLKEEKILKRLGYKLPFIVDLSLQLSTYGLIDSIYLDEQVLVNKLW